MVEAREGRNPPAASQRSRHVQRPELKWSPARRVSGGEDIDELYAALEASLQGHLRTVRYLRALLVNRSKPQVVAAFPEATDPARDATVISKGKRRRDRRKRAQAARTQGEAAAGGEMMQTEEGGTAATPSPKITPHERDKCARSPVEASAWAKAPPFVPGAKEKVAAAAAAPVADSRGRARADKAAKNPKSARALPRPSGENLLHRQAPA